jgi:predicted deacylase
VAIPALCPAGLRTKQREPYHAPEDPNRLWPDGRPTRPPDPDKAPPNSLELAYGRLSELISASADFLIDFHNAAIGSLSFAIRDRVLYAPSPETGLPETTAADLSARLGEMIRAYGHTCIREFPVAKYIDEKLHRSTSAAALLQCGIPAFTAELGGGLMPDPRIISAAAAGTRNVMRWAGMLEGDPEPIEGIPVVDAGFPVRRCRTPRVKDACVALHVVGPGDMIAAGQPVAELRDVWGRPMSGGILRSDYDGFVIGRSQGIFFYPGDALLSMAIRDDLPLTGPYPSSFFEP